MFFLEPPLPCCALGEDDPDHDVQACMDTQAEDNANAEAERQREQEMHDLYEREENT